VDVTILDTLRPWPAEERCGYRCQLRKIVAGTFDAGQISMTTTLLVLGGIWMALAMVFCLALAAAAAKPRPEFEAGRETVGRRHAASDAIDARALCAR